MSPTAAPPARKPASSAPAIKAVGPLPPPIVPPPAEKPKPTPPPARPDASAVELAPTPLQGRMYAPIDIACPHQNADFTNCGAAENEPCAWQQSGMEGTYHAERIADAAAASRGSGIEPTELEFENAVEDSGLV